MRTYHATIAESIIVTIKARKGENMGLWNSIEAHANVINGYSMTREYLNICATTERWNHMQLVSASAKPDKNYAKMLARNYESLNGKAVKIVKI